MDRSPELSAPEIETFRNTVWDHYREQGRDLPWRRTRDPYEIMVSEYMLQQTQVSRVELKFPDFLERFPDLGTLADASPADLLTAWQGLGYNRRALALHRAARLVVEEHAGLIPDSYNVLLTLPGIGPATAGALLAFAFNIPVAFIETNIRRVFIHSFFPDRDGVPDGEILPMIEATLDRDRPREWYYALMDFGSTLPKEGPNPNLRSVHYSRQSPFDGSDRQVRGDALKILLVEESLSLGELLERVSADLDGVDRERLERITDGLVSDGFLVREGEQVSIAP